MAAVRLNSTSGKIGEIRLEKGSDYVGMLSDFFQLNSTAWL